MAYPFEEKQSLKNYPWSFLFGSKVPKSLKGKPVLQFPNLVMVGNTLVSSRPNVDDMHFYYEMGYFNQQVVEVLCGFYSNNRDTPSLDPSVVFHPKVLTACCEAFLECSKRRYESNDLPTSTHNFFRKELSLEWNYFLGYEKISSLVCRCIEYNLLTSLEIFLECYFDKLILSFERYIQKTSLVFSDPVANKLEKIVVAQNWIFRMLCFSEKIWIL